MENLTLQSATQRLANRRATDAHENQRLYLGDHLNAKNDFSGYIGILPDRSAPEYAFVTEWLTRIFAATNLVKSSVNRNVDGTLSREPDYGAKYPKTFTDAQKEKLEEEINDTLINWWNEAQILQTVLREAARVSLLEGEAYLRPRLPYVARSENNRITPSRNLADAFNLIEFEIVTAENAGIFTDPETGKKYSVCQITQDGKKTVEISWVGANGLTYLRILQDDDVKFWAKENLSTLADYITKEGLNTATDATPFDLGGLLYLQRISREQLITETTRRLQNSINYSLTTMLKNLNIAGDRRIDYGNAQTPKDVVETRDADGKVLTRTVTDAPLVNSASNSNFLTGVPIFDYSKLDESGNPMLVDYKDVSQFVVDPVAVDTFVKAFEIFRMLFLDEVFQGHILANDLTVSGKSRQESRNEFEKSLKATKTAMDPAGRYILEFSLKMAAALSGRSKEFTGIRFDFNCLITVGAIDLEEIKHAAEDVKDGRISLFDYLVLKGVEDPDASIQRIQSAPGYVLTQIERAAEISAKSLGAIPVKGIVEFLPIGDEEKETILGFLVDAPVVDEGVKTGLPVGV